MSVDPQVLARARARVLGTPSVAVSEPVPAGVNEASDGTRVWLLPGWPDGATPAVLEEYETAPMPLDRAGQARRVLAAALRCCWPRLDDGPWPGSPAAVADVLEVYAGMSRGDADLARRWAMGELRRLADTGWLLLDETTGKGRPGTVRPGPRTALWADRSLASLRDLLRRLPQPPAPVGETPASANDPSSSEPQPDPSASSPSPSAPVPVPVPATEPEPQPTVSAPEPEAPRPRSAVSDSEPEAQEPQPPTSEPAPETSGLKPGTHASQPSVPESRPGTSKAEVPEVGVAVSNLESDMTKVETGVRLTGAGSAGVDSGSGVVSSGAPSASGSESESSAAHTAAATGAEIVDNSLEGADE